MIYQTSQQCMRYLVEFKCATDKASKPPPGNKMSNASAFSQKPVQPDWQSKLVNLEDMMYKPITFRQKMGKLL